MTKYRYDKETGKLVEKPEPRTDRIELLPPPCPSAIEYYTVVEEMRRLLRG